MKKIKLLTLAFAAFFAGSAMAETENHPASASSSTDVVGTSYTIDGNYIAGTGGNKAGTMSTKGVKFRINRTYNKTANAVPFIVNEGYKITGISFDGQINDNSKTSVLSKILVDDAEITFTSVTLPAKTSSARFSTGTIEAKKNVVLIFDGAASQANVEYTVTYEKAQIAADDATLKSITVGGEALEGFSAETETYNVELPYGTVDVPFVAAVATSAKANVVVNHAASLPGATTIVVTAEDGTTTKTYTINFTVAQTLSDDATIGVLAVDSKDVPGYRADSFNYSYQLPYNYEGLPIVTAHANDETATVVITQATEIPGTATVVSTAQAGNTLTYTIAFTKAAAPKILKEVLFSNGAKGASAPRVNEDETIDYIVRVPYLEGTNVPAIVSATADNGGTAAVSADSTKITVTGIDNTTLDYTIEYVVLAPVSLGTEVVTFDSTETFIFAPYGWDESKGWKFAKNVEDASNRRVSEGRTRIYMALPAAKEVILTSGTGGARPIKLFVNGVENTEIKSTADKGATMTISLDSKNNNFIAIESNQEKGDGGFTAIQLVPAGESAIDNAVVTETVQKMLINGQLVIIKNGVRYNAQGMQL